MFFLPVGASSNASKCVIKVITSGCYTVTRLLFGLCLQVNVNSWKVINSLHPPPYHYTVHEAKSFLGSEPSPVRDRSEDRWSKATIQDCRA